MNRPVDTKQFKALEKRVVLLENKLAAHATQIKALQGLLKKITTKKPRKKKAS